MEDICSNKHGGNPESVAAFGTGKDSQRQRVLQAIRESGGYGLTCDDVAKQFNCHCNAVSGRFAELKRLGLIRKIGTRPTRTGSRAGVFTVKLTDDEQVGF